MNCNEAIERVSAYVDGELAGAELAALGVHLDACPACRRERSTQSCVRMHVSSHATYHTTPASLARSVRRQMPAERSAPRKSWWRGWAVPIPMPAAGAAFAVLLAGNVYLAAQGPSREQRIADEVVTSHVRALVGDRPFDVASSNRHTVKPWYTGKLDFSPPVADFPEEDFRLAGGRVDYVDSRPVAALVYRRGAHLVDVFVWPASGRSDARASALSTRGYGVRHWVSGGMAYWMASDMDERESDRLQRLLEGARGE